MPLWSGLIAVLLLGERLSTRFAVALAMGVTGVVLLSLRGGGFAWRLPAALVATLGARHQRLKLVARYGLLDGAWGEPGKANWLREIAFAELPAALTGIVEPEPVRG